MPSAKKVLVVFGTRPEAIKLAPVVKELEKYPADLSVEVVVTGQHRQMLDQVLNIFGITPAEDLNIMKPNQTLGEITLRALAGLEKVVAERQPQMVVVQGDTTTTFVASLAAFYHKVPLAHVEAGLRTGEKYSPFPEEINRSLTSVLADLHFAPTTMSVYNLRNNGVESGKIFLTGNTVIDALDWVAARPPQLAWLNPAAAGKRIVTVTAHRRESLGQPLRNIATAVRRLVEERQDVFVVLPVHKNPLVAEVVREVLGGLDRVQLTDPLDYEPFVHLMKNSYLILTDSGGIQEEAPSLGVPVLVLRQTTERPEAVMANVVRVVGTGTENIVENALDLLDNSRAYKAMAHRVNPYGDGRASGRIAQAIRHFFGQAEDRPADFLVAHD